MRPHARCRRMFASPLTPTLSESHPSAMSRPLTPRVDMLVMGEVMTTPHRVRSTRRRGAGRSGKKLPVGSLEMFISTSPAGSTPSWGATSSAPRSFPLSVPSGPQQAGRPCPSQVTLQRVLRDRGQHVVQPPHHGAQQDLLGRNTREVLYGQRWGVMCGCRSARDRSSSLIDEEPVLVGPPQWH